MIIISFVLLSSDRKEMTVNILSFILADDNKWMIVMQNIFTEQTLYLHSEYRNFVTVFIVYIQHNAWLGGI